MQETKIKHTRLKKKTKVTTNCIDFFIHMFFSKWRHRELYLERALDCNISAFLLQRIEGISVSQNLYTTSKNKTSNGSKLGSMPFCQPVSVSMVHIIVQDWVMSLSLWLCNFSVTRVTLILDGLLHRRSGAFAWKWVEPPRKRSNEQLIASPFYYFFLLEVLNNCSCVDMVVTEFSKVNISSSVLSIMYI